MGMLRLAVGVRFEGILNFFSDAVPGVQPAQELPPEIGRSGADGGEQFRVGCLPGL